MNDKIWFICHLLNEEKCVKRLLDSISFIPKERIIILIDDRTTDDTPKILDNLGIKYSYFKWKHNFSYAKNLCIAVAVEQGMKIGDWLLLMGGDFELQPHAVSEILDFVKTSNLAAKFQIPEFSPTDKPVVTRARCLLWRYHPLLYFERLVHEEMVYSLYRKLGIGIPFTPEKELRILGGENAMKHYADHEDSPELKWEKRNYYLALFETDLVMQRFHYYSNEEGMLKALARIFKTDDVYLWGIDKAIEKLTEQIKEGDVPKGLIEFHTNKKFLEGAEYLW